MRVVEILHSDCLIGQRKERYKVQVGVRILATRTLEALLTNRFREL